MTDKKQELLREHHDQEEHWVSVSDLMAGLMMIFLLIAIIYMVNVEEEKDRIQEVAILYHRLKTELYEDLKSEFHQDFKKWGAVLYDDDLTIRFNEPTILFALGDHALKPLFGNILSDFFPRYVSIITSEKYKDSISEIRIEGHTSSIWYNASNEDAYFLNMQLSQARTRSTLRYVLSLPDVDTQVPWLRKYVTANGLSSSRLIKKDGVEDVARSQRVEFRIITNAEERMAKILELDL